MQTHPQTSATYANHDFRSRQKTFGSCMGMQKMCLDVVNVLGQNIQFLRERQPVHYRMQSMLTVQKNKCLSRSTF